MSIEAPIIYDLSINTIHMNLLNISQLSEVSSNQFVPQV